MLNSIDSYASAWNLVEIELLAQTSRGHSYKAELNGDIVVLKIYIGEGLKSEKRGVELLKICKNRGMVSILKADGDVVLMEYCDGQSLKNLVAKGEDSQATKIIAGILNKIHACPIPKGHKFKTLQERLAPMSEMSKKNHPAYEKSLFVKAADLAEKLCSDQQDICLLHGDMHHSNVINDSKKGWLAIDPKGYIGDRAYDTANTLLHPWDLPELVRDKDRFLQQATILSEHMNIDRQKIIHFAFVFASYSAARCLELELHSEHEFAMARIIEPFV